MQETTKRKILRASCHASALVSWSMVAIGLPIAVLLLSDDPMVKDSAKEAINFQITMIVLTWISVGLFFTVLGIPLALVIFAYVGIASLILPIVAIVSVCSDPERTYRYPLIIRLIKPSLPDRIATTG